MQYGIRLEFPDMTQAVYEQLTRQLTPKARAHPGFVTHIAGPMDGGGWYVIEVWASREANEAFMQEEVFPVMPPDAPQPSVTEFEVYNFHATDVPVTSA